MASRRAVCLVFGIPSLLLYGALVAAQWRAALALSLFTELQKAHPPKSLEKPDETMVARKQSLLSLARRMTPSNPEPVYEAGLLEVVLAEATSLNPRTAGQGTQDRPDPKVVGFLVAGLQALNRAIDLNPGNAEYHFVKATILQNLQGSSGTSEKDSAISVAVEHLLAEAGRLDPYKPSLQFRIGSFWLALGNRSKATRAFSIALIDSYHYAQTIIDLLWTSSEGIEEMRTLMGDEPFAHGLLGDFLWSNGYREEANKEYLKAEQARPMDYRVGELLVQQHFRAGDFDAARGVLKVLWDESQDWTTAQRARIRYFEGQSYYLEKRLEDAITKYEEAVSIDPAVFYIHESLGKAYADVGDIDRAIARFEFVLGKTRGVLPPKEAAALRVELAQVYEKKELYTKALDQYLKATQLDPANQFALKRATELGKEHL